MAGSIGNILQGRIAVVTGGGSGIGAGIAQGLAKHGVYVVVTGRHLDSLTETVAVIEEAGGKASCYVLDVADSAACKEVADRIAQEVGAVSILVNNAGNIHYANIDSPDVLEAWERSLSVNLSGPFNMALAFREALRETKGSVINISSIAGFIYTSNTPGYSASKGGVNMLTVALAKELGPDGVRVNSIAPGAINTPMSPSSSNPDSLARLMLRVPLKRIGQPEDLVGPVVFLASEMSAYVTGTTLVVDGGYLTN